MWIYRIKYSKRGGIRFISHLDTMRALIRALKRAGVPFAYSEGFNPRPKISMGPALPLGYESVCELADITLTASIAPESLRERLARTMPEGLALLEIESLSSSSPRLSRASSICYVLELPEGGGSFEGAESLVREFNQKDAAPVERIRKDKAGTVDVKQFTKDVQVVAEEDSCRLRVEILLGERGSCSPTEVARAIFDLPEESAKCLRITRTDIRLNGR